MFIVADLVSLTSPTHQQWREKLILFSWRPEKNYFNVEIEYLLRNSKLRQCRNYFTVICTTS